MHGQAGRVVVAAVLLVTVAACSDTNTPTPPAAASPAATTTSASPSTSPSTTPSRDASNSASLRSLVLKQSDFSRTDLTLDTDGVEAAPEADDLSHPSFDYCGGTFRQEGSRVERYSVVAGFTKPQAGAIYNEVVRYSSPDQARAALDEFRTAVRDCDKGSYPSVLNDGEDVTFRPQQGPSTVDELEQDNTVVQSELVSQGKTVNLTQFISQYGDALVITYGATQGQTQTKVNEAVGALGTLVGQRL